MSARRSANVGKYAIVRKLMVTVLSGILALPCYAGQNQRVYRSARAQRRPFTVSDLFRLQELGIFAGGPYAYSIGGGALAITILRPINTDPSQRWSELQAGLIHSDGTADIWVQGAMGEPLRDITHGETDRSGWFSPQWSPDGVRLAMLSTRGGELRLWVWNRLTGRRRLVSRDAVAFSVQQRNTPRDQPYVWLDSRRILFTALSKTPEPGLASVYQYMSSQTPLLATEAWQRYISGAQPTASVLDDLKDPGPSPGADLVLVDLAGQQRVVARNIDTVLWQPSPAADAVALTRAIRTRVRPSERLQGLLAVAGLWRTEVVSLDGRRIVGMGSHGGHRVIQGSLSWSPDGKTLAYLGYATPRGVAPTLYLLNVGTGQVRAVPVGAFGGAPGALRENPGFADQRPIWTARGKLLVRGVPVTGGARSDVSEGNEQQWWLISQDGAGTCVTCRMPAVPSSLWAETGRRYFFGLAGGKLWRIDVSSGQVEDITERFHSPVQDVISPPRLSGIPYTTGNRSLNCQTYKAAIFQLSLHGALKSYVVDLNTGGIMPIPPAPQGARLVWADAGANFLIYVRNDQSGLSLWRRSVHTGRTELLFSGNTFLRGIVAARLAHFPYTSLDGRKLQAWLLLPPRYQAGERYPTITVVYPTYSYSAPEIPETLELQTAVSSVWEFNMQIAAAHGYAVLFPSIPLTEADRPVVGIKVFNDVMPAVEAAVVRGFADPGRLAVWGTSYGGEAVFDLISRTDRFRAAIASNGLSDLISAYGALDARYRYDDRAQTYVGGDEILESGEMNLGGPPWEQWLRYIDNSPIFSIRHIHTPVLMTTGDLDPVPMEQSEELFRALVRLNRPVRLVRYWGEGHGLDNPANIRNYWRQIFSWLQTYLPLGSDNGHRNH